MRDWFKAEVENLDFTSQRSAGVINNWCSKHTDGMIPQIIDRVEPSAVAYLMNAIYFNGSWTDKFDAKSTKLERFQGYTRDIKKVKMMQVSYFVKRPFLQRLFESTVRLLSPLL